MSLATPARAEMGTPATIRIELPRPLPRTIGMGAHLKASLCVIRGPDALISDTAGDLSTLEALRQYERLRAWAEAILPEPGCVGHDLHPDFLSTRAARAAGFPTRAVQHHHAHILAAAWEHGVTGPVLGLALDGFGLGDDGGLWGGELFCVEGLGYRRLGHLAPLAQPGGDMAAREPWRMAAAALAALGRGDEVATRFADRPHAALLARMLETGAHAPMTTSCGRLFDAACGLLGIYPVAAFEGQAPMALEALADVPEVMVDGWRVRADGVLDLLPLLEHISHMPSERGACLFHGTLAAALCAWVQSARARTGLDIVAMGGGCFFNKVLTGLLREHLENAGLTVLLPERLSPGDAGLSFGQAIAAALAVEHGDREGMPCV